MKAQIIIAESASSHPDHTFSVLRGGINSIGSPSFPTVFEGAIVIRIGADPAESGRHSFRCILVDQDGGELSRFELSFEVPQGGGNSILIARTRQSFPRPGLYSFRVAIDGHVMGDESFTASQIEPPEEEATVEPSPERDDPGGE